MKRIIYYLMFAVFFFLFIKANSQVVIETTEVDTTTVIKGLDIPWEILWGPDDHLWVTERFGRVSRIHPESGVQDIILDISSAVFQQGESGLLGMVLHPDFTNFPYVYLAYTYLVSSEIKERIVRYEYNGTSLLNETILLDNIRGNTTHDGCRLIITPDMKLLITTGDAQNQPAAQDLQDLSGKILRLNLDGSIPNDNPFPGNPVYTYGHRNAQGLYLAQNGILYSSEHGPSTDDEFNIIEAGRNYGWPNVHGFCDLPDEITFCEEHNVKEPQTAWTPTVATSDIIYFDHPAIPEWQGSVLMTTLKNKRIYELELDEDGATVLEEKQFFQNWWGRLRDICVSPNGEIYLATNGPSWSNTQPFTHSIIKISNANYLGTDQDKKKPESAEINIYPNPCSGSMSLRYQIKDKGHLISDLFSISGLRIKRLLNEEMMPGEYEMEVDIRDLPAGVYFFRMQAGAQVEVQKLVIL